MGDGPREKITASSGAGRVVNAFRASQRSEIDSFIVMDVMRRAAQLQRDGADVVHMEVGQPATAAPRRAREALATALSQDNLGYTLALGKWSLRERISQYYRDRHGLGISPDRIVVTTGSSGAFVLAFLAVFDVGARVGLPNPGYPCYRQILSALGQVPLNMETGPENHWMPTGEEIKQHISKSNLSGVVIASPANPTGTMIDAGRLAEICDVTQSTNTWFVSDEIYHGLTYEAPAQTALKFSDAAIVINSFSKYYSMTGWRVGWMVVPEGLVKTVERLAQNLFISAPAPGQVAALSAFDCGEELEANRIVYAENRSYLLDALPNVGLENFAPADGAFYLYCDISHLTEDSLAFSHAMLNDIHVAATPGIDFDGENGHRFIRFSYATTHERIIEAVNRLRSWPVLTS